MNKCPKYDNFIFARGGSVLSGNPHQEKGEDAFEAKLGIMYSGKELESKKAKHRRYRLKEKVIYGGIEGADDFGERIYIRGEEKLSLSLARNLLLVSDGARWISDIAGADYLKATYQLD